MVLTDMDVVSQLSIKYRLRKVIPVSNKNDPICANTIFLSYSKPITVGRTLSEDVQVRLLSKTTPLMISRRHASIFISDDGKINIEDHNSMNGVYVSNKRITPATPHQIKVGEKVAFGCGVGTNVPEFEFYLEAIPSTPVAIRRMDSPRTDEYEYIQSSPAKRKRTPLSSPALTVDSPSLTIIESNAAQIKEQEDKIRQLSIDLKQKEEDQDELMNRLEETEKGLLEKLEDQRQQLEQERNEAEDHLRQLLERQLQEKESTLKNEYDEQIRLLQKEKDVVEKNLQNELSCKLSEKDECYQKALQQQKAALEKAMTDKENEKNTLIAQLKAKEGLIEKYQLKNKSVEENQRQLENSLEELRREIENKEAELNKQKEYTKKVESDAKQTVIQTMEDEFTCIICQELFVDATTLPCAHSFCELCLRLWLRKKKTCPVCRRKLKVKAFRSVVLDSAIEKMIEAMDDDTRKRRVELKREREEQKRCEDAAEDPEGIRDMIHRAEDEDGNDDWDNNSPRGRNDRSMNDNRNRGNRNSYRRRSRSRSPRNQHIRHRPYHDNRFSYNGSNQGGSSSNFQNQNQNAAQIFHQLTSNYSSQRFYTDRMEGYQPYFPNNFQNHFSGNNQQYAPSYNSNNNRCFVCGSTEHLARFCPRR